MLLPPRPRLRVGADTLGADTLGIDALGTDTLGVSGHQQVKLRRQRSEVDLYVEARWFAAVEGGLQSRAQVLDARHVLGMAAKGSRDVVVTGIGEACADDVSGA